MRRYLAAALVTGPLLGAHPMHTSVTELAHEPASRTVAVTVRVFADDFTAAAGAGDSAAAAYLRPRLTLTDRAGRPIALRWERLEPAGAALLLRLRGDAPAGLAGVRVTHTLLCDRFDDQINIVRATYAGRGASLLFTRGDPPKTLP
ncbi:MAG: DUF6702 family protein [Gemmatimonadales bacterium]